MSSVRYYNQTAPFWDFVASMEDQGIANRGAATESEQEQPNPWTHGWAGFPFGGPMPTRGRHGHGPRVPHPHHHEGPPEPPAYEQEIMNSSDNEEKAGPSESKEKQPETDNPESGEKKCGPGARRGGRCAGRGRGAWGGRGGPWAHGRGGPHHGGPHRGGPWRAFGPLAEMFQNQWAGAGAKDGSEDFSPDVDVFDTAESFVIHVSLPGAKKEDVGVNWDSEKSELTIAGVVHRPGDEELLKSLAMDERKVGPFERKVRLGSRASPAHVDVDAITARMEDGILRVDVPKLDSGYVEIKKVDIE